MCLSWNYVLIQGIFGLHLNQSIELKCWFVYKKHDNLFEKHGNLYDFFKNPGHTL